MTFTRVAIRAARAAPRAQVVRQSARRGYSSGHQQHTQSGSDLPWALGGVAVTVPTCYYLLKSSPEEAHHLHKPGPPHGTEVWPQNERNDPMTKAENSPDGKPKTEKRAEHEEPRNESPGEEAKDDSVAGVKKSPESKGEAPPTEEGDRNYNDRKEDMAVNHDTAPKDYASPIKPPGGGSTMSGKQEGLSNSDTRHPVYAGPGGSFSHKGEGSPESSKSKGTIDPSHSAAGDDAKQEEENQEYEKNEQANREAEEMSAKQSEEKSDDEDKKDDKKDE